jgi:hypothetical protein
MFGGISLRRKDEAVLTEKENEKNNLKTCGHLESSFFSVAQ